MSEPESQSINKERDMEEIIEGQTEQKGWDIASLQIECDRLASMFGGKAYVIASVTSSRYLCTGSVVIYPEDIINNEHQRFEADTFAEALRQAEIWAAGYKTIHRNAIIRKMALAIIDIVDEMGGPTAKDLERKGFSKDEVLEFHLAACERAAEMAGCAPFAVQFDAEV